MIEVKHISKYYLHNNKKINVLNDVSFNIQDKKIFGILGKSGSGKTTLLKIISGLEQASFGEIFINSQDYSCTNTNISDKIGMIFQDFYLLENLTVYQNIQLPLKIKKKVDTSKIDEIIEFIHLKDKSNSFPNQLSGGEKQRVAIARALVTEPRILLCDEPTSSLDSYNTFNIISLLKKINITLSTTIVIVSHVLETIKQLCSKAAVLEQGRLKGVIDINNKEVKVFNSYYEEVKEKLKC